MDKNQFKELQRVKVTDHLLNGIIQKIVEHFHPLKIFLFGSHVWGEPGPNSDLDLLVVMKSEERPAKRASKNRKVCRPRFLPMDILVRTPQEIQKRLEMNDFFIKGIIESGKVIYEKAP